MARAEGVYDMHKWAMSAGMVWVGHCERQRFGLASVTQHAATADPRSAMWRQSGRKRLTDQIIKNTYRVLMSRGMKGCYVYATDESLREYLREASVDSNGARSAMTSIR
jgi:DUF2075 family protein